MLGYELLVGSWMLMTKLEGVGGFFVCSAVGYVSYYEEGGKIKRDCAIFMDLEQ